jgi:hypothetical protein
MAFPGAYGTLVLSASPRLSTWSAATELAIYPLTMSLTTVMERLLQQGSANHRPMQRPAHMRDLQQVSSADDRQVMRQDLAIGRAAG